jgi:hypothetical protein
MNVENFIDPEILQKFYQEGNPLHKVYVGELVSAYKN